MNLLELHKLFSLPFSCPNRDEDGMPKSGTFGGTTRARLSSQNQKRPVREYCHEIDPDHFQGIRTMMINRDLGKALSNKGITDPRYAEAVANMLGTNEKDGSKTKTLLFFSPAEIETLASSIADALKSNKESSIFKIKDDKIEAKSGLGKFLKNAHLLDMTDILLFGRMVASDHSLTIEGASMFSHALSIHKVRNEVDFFAAVNETKDCDDAGAAYVNENYFNSACYYSTIQLNTSLFGEQLSFVDVQTRRDILKNFITACLLSFPKARQNSMFGASLPGFVLGLVRNHCMPLSLANAFEEPIKPSPSGYLKPAAKALMEHWQRTKRVYRVGDIVVEAQLSILEDVDAKSQEDIMTQDKFIDLLISNVW